ncbi:hypothetical protein BV22DRAFT_1082931, partial [Leucogyrophana mollusca]
MGGRAFLQVFPADSFPRLPPSLYKQIKIRLRSRLQVLYAIVEVPAEAPEKVDHGDLDFVVTRPLNTAGIVTHEEVKEALGATKAIELEGNRTSNYAVPICDEDWGSCERLGVDGGAAQIYVQVDIRVCDTEEEVESILVFHGFGDLGIIIGSISDSYGLSVGTKGMKISSPQPDPPIHLTSSPSEIFEFLGLSMDTWKQGFTTQEAAFEFAATSRFFDPQRLHKPKTASKQKTAVSRSMYRDFLVWAQGAPAERAVAPTHNAVEEALVHFGRKDEWDARARERYEKNWLKENFNGKLVAEWTGLGWKGVKTVMDAVRANAGGEQLLVGRELYEVKRLVNETKDALEL